MAIKKNAATSAKNAPIKETIKPAVQTPSRPISGATTKKSADSFVRDHLVRELAYFKAESRGFQNGDELSDWLAAEKEVNDKSI